MHAQLIAAVLHVIYSACAAAVIVLIAIAYVKYRAFR